MCRHSSLCAEKPKVIVARSPLKLAPRHERHEQQVGQQVLEAEPDRDEELERAGRHARRRRTTSAPTGTRPGRASGGSCASRRSTCCSCDSVWISVCAWRSSSMLWHSAANRAPGPLRWRARKAKLPVRGVLQRRDALEEQLHRVEVAGVGRAAGGPGPGRSRRARRRAACPSPPGTCGRRRRSGGTGPPTCVPVMDLDALEPGVGVHLLRVDVARVQSRSRVSAGSAAASTACGALAIVCGLLSAPR